MSFMQWNVLKFNILSTIFFYRIKCKSGCMSTSMSSKNNMILREKSNYKPIQASVYIFKLVENNVSSLGMIHISSGVHLGRSVGIEGAGASGDLRYLLSIRNGKGNWRQTAVQC